MQKRKIFIEIDVPEAVKKRLSEKTEKWKDLPIKWTKKHNLHITLLFLGYIGDESVMEVCQKVSEAVNEMEAFDIEFSKIELGPDEENPRMIWATGEPSEELKNLRQVVEKSLDLFQGDKKKFSPHITLGKIRKTKWEELEKKPEIKENIKILIPVEEIKIMESKIDEEGSEYHVIENCPLS